MTSCFVLSGLPCKPSSPLNFLFWDGKIDPSPAPLHKVRRNKGEERKVLWREIYVSYISYTYIIYILYISYLIYHTSYIYIKLHPHCTKVYEIFSGLQIICLTPAGKLHGHSGWSPLPHNLDPPLTFSKFISALSLGQALGSQRWSGGIHSLVEERPPWIDQALQVLL